MNNKFNFLIHKTELIKRVDEHFGYPLTNDIDSFSWLYFSKGNIEYFLESDFMELPKEIRLFARKILRELKEKSLE